MSNNGRCVLYVENTDGKVGQTYDEEGNPAAVMGKHFRIFASTLAGDLFTEPFVMCELDHPVDQITTFLTSGGMLSALATHIVSAEKSEAELHGIEVPWWRVPLRRARSLPRARWCPEQQVNPLWSRCETTATPC